MSDHSISRLAITAGEPGGIGPDLVLQLALQDTPQSYEKVCIASRELLLQRAQKLGINIELIDFKPELPATTDQPGQLKIIDIKTVTESKPGQLNSNNARYVLETLKRATQGCLQGQFDAMVTGPLHKGIINDAGIAFTGHTEYLADLCGQVKPVMMLATESMRVALATTHLPLKDVSAAITQSSLTEVIEILHNDLTNRFGITSPKIFICGLNPHAGENGYLGHEEIDTIQPVIEKLRSEGMNLSDALPADTLFTQRYLKEADAFLAMYHDQGLPVLKHSGFGKAVNITLGLPIIRTSVDHGTALDLAGSGKADVSSFIYACDVANQMAQSQRKVKTHAC